MTTSRLSHARQAVRPALKGRMMLSGPSGAGKTRSSLIIAGVLAEGAPILGIDTEKESMLTYADDFDFVHLPWAPPFDPRELVDVLAEAGDQYGVIIIDSASHFWRGDGGTLDIAAGKFTGWKEARPIQEALVEAILASKAHVLLGVRSKVEHTQETENGKQVVKKLGMAAQQDADLEFEMNVAVEMTMDHTATISKTRTTVLPVGRAFKAGHAADLGAIYRDWLKAGEPPAATAEVKKMLERIEALEPAKRKACKDEFFALFGRPDHLRESQVPDALALIARHENRGPDGPGTATPKEGAGVDGPQGDGSHGVETTPKPGPSETTDLAGSRHPEVGRPGPEPTPAPALGSGSPGPDPKAAPDLMAALEASLKAAKPPAGRAGPGPTVHKRARELKISEEDLDAIILNCTGGRTGSAKELGPSEVLAVVREMECVDAGFMAMADVHAAVEAFKAQQQVAS